VKRTEACRAHVICPVDTLVDVGLIVSPAGGVGTLRVSVTAGGRVVGRGELAAGSPQPIQYVRVDLDVPLGGCRGADLIVEAVPDPAAAAGPFHAWTYPVYYAGVTRQGGRPIDQRSLGVAFNAFSYGLMD